MDQHGPHILENTYYNCTPYYNDSFIHNETGMCFPYALS